MYKLFASPRQLVTLQDMLARTKRGIEQTRANIKRMSERKHEPGSKLEQTQRDAIARLEEIVLYQARVITTLTAVLGEYNAADL